MRLFYKICPLFLVFIFSNEVACATPDDTLFETDAVIYDKNTGKFTTIGDVKIDYKDNKLLTKEMEYDTTTNEITAKGKVDITNTTSVMDTENLIINTKDETASLGAINVKFGENSYAKAENAIMKSQQEIVLKDVELPDNSVVAAGTTVSKSFNQPNIIIGGSPNRILKEHINWALENVNKFDKNVIEAVNEIV